MKILIISDAWHPQVNGVVRTYEHLCTELVKLGHEIKVIGPADFPLTIPMPGYKEIKLVLFPYSSLKHYIEDFAPDSVHIATEGPLGRAARRYCLRTQQSFSTSYHTQFPDYLATRIARYIPFSYALTHKTARNYIRRFHAPSSSLMVSTLSIENELKKWGFVTPIYRLTRGVDLDIFHPGEKTVMTDLPGPIALYVGRIAIEKNIEDFLKMDWKGTKVLVGDGPSMSELKSKYPNAHFAGTKTGQELAAYYRSADIFVFPSRTDTFGMVLIEALASGLPVAAYKAPGPIDIITEPLLGALSETNLTEAAQKSLNAPGSAEQRAEHIKQNYTWEIAARQFLEAIM